MIQTKYKNMQNRYSKEFKETLIDLYSMPNESSVSKADFLELKRQLAKVTEERDILKKVLTIFAEKKK